MLMNKRRKRSRGQAMVEFALVFPLFLVIILGLIEIAFYFKDRLGIQIAVLDAARSISAAGTQPSSDDAALRAITTSGLLGLNYNNVRAIKIYDASKSSCAGVVLSNPNCADPVFNRYHWGPNAFGVYTWLPDSTPGGWDPATRKTIDPTDIAAITISYRHDWVNPFMHALSSSIDLTATTLMPIEPLCYKGNPGDFCGQ